MSPSVKLGPESAPGAEGLPPQRLTPETLRQEFIRQSIKAPKGDPYIRAFSEAFDALYEVPAVQDLLETFLEVRQLKGPMLQWHAHNQIFRAYQAQLIKQEVELGYPQNFAHADGWVEHLLRISESRDLGFEADLLFHSVQSNVSGRYRSVAMILDALQDRYPKDAGRQTVTALDVACSLNRGYKHLATDIAFDQIKESRTANLQAVNTGAWNRLRFQESLGIDLKSLNDPSTRWWAEACSMYPSERLNRDLVETYQKIDNTEIEGLGFEDADFTEMGAEGKWDPRGGMHPSRIHRYDVVTLYTFLYQLNHDEHERALMHALSAAKRDGIIIIQDFMDTPPDDGQSMIFGSSSKEWSYGTFALDLRQPEKGLQPLFVWNNGRCEKLELRLERHDPAAELQNTIFSRYAA